MSDDFRNCEKYRETLFREPQLPEVEKHLKDCSECREYRKVIDSIRKNGSLFPETLPAGISEKILSEYDKFQKLKSSNAYSFLHIRHLFALCGVLCMVFIALAISFRNPDEKLKEVFNIYSANANQPIKASLNHTISLDMPETLLIKGSDNSSVEFTGPGKIQLLTRGFILSSGMVHVTVKPGGESVYSVKTPHGTVEVLGTHFRCRVTTTGTEVHVFMGTVKLTSSNGRQQILKASQTGQILDEKHDIIPEKLGLEINRLPIRDPEHE